MKPPRIALLGEYTPTYPPHLATETAFSHSRVQLGTEVEAIWISTSAINERLFERFSGIWVAPGSPYKDMEKTLWAIRYARENRIRCLGTCGGFQHLIIEYARNVLGFRDAQHAEYDPYASDLFISRLACSLVGREMTLQFTPGSCVAGIYGSTSVRERYYCDFGVNPDRVEPYGANIRTNRMILLSDNITDNCSCNDRCPTALSRPRCRLGGLA